MVRYHAVPGEEGWSNEVLIELRPAQSKLHVHLRSQCCPLPHENGNVAKAAAIKQCSVFAQ